MEREFKCNGTKKEPHATELVIILAKVGTVPDAPDCPVCGSKTQRVYEPTAVKYHPNWGTSKHWT